jgi:hypothetical protein
MPPNSINARKRRRIFKKAESSQQERSIIIVSWGRNGRSSWSFHKCILIADSVITEVRRDTTGMHWDWGSIVENVKITKKPPVQIKRFSPSMFDKGELYRNSYLFRGTTDWSDAKIKQLCKLDTVFSIYTLTTS